MRGIQNFLGGLKNKVGKAFRGPVKEGCKDMFIFCEQCWGFGIKASYFFRAFSGKKVRVFWA